MEYSLIACKEGVDTVALQHRYPELLLVTAKKGADSWTLRPDVKAVIRAHRVRAPHGKKRATDMS